MSLIPSHWSTSRGPASQADKNAAESMAAAGLPPGHYPTTEHENWYRRNYFAIRTGLSLADAAAAADAAISPGAPFAVAPAATPQLVSAGSVTPGGGRDFALCGRGQVLVRTSNTVISVYDEVLGTVSRTFDCSGIGTFIQDFACDGRSLVVAASTSGASTKVGVFDYVSGVSRGISTWHSTSHVALRVHIISQTRAVVYGANGSGSAASADIARLNLSTAAYSNYTDLGGTVYSVASGGDFVWVTLAATSDGTGILSSGDTEAQLFADDLTLNVADNALGAFATLGFDGVTLWALYEVGTTPGSCKLAVMHNNWGGPVTGAASAILRTVTLSNEFDRMVVADGSALLYDSTGSLELVAFARDLGVTWTTSLTDEPKQVAFDGLSWVYMTAASNAVLFYSAICPLLRPRLVHAPYGTLASDSFDRRVRGPFYFQPFGE